MRVVPAVVRVLSWLVLTIVALTLLLIAPLVAGYHPVVVLSGSMMPNYPVGSVTYYKSAAYEDISVGDAITFRIGDGQELATHRVTAKDDAAQSFTTKGDHNETEDANPVSYSQVAGKTTGLAIPYVGYFVRYAQQWYVLGTCGLILVLDILLSPAKKPQTAGEAVLQLLQESDKA